MRKILFFMLVAALACFPSQLLAAECSKPEVFVASLVEQVKLVATNAAIDDEKKIDELTGLVKENLNIQWVGKYALGKNWRELDDVKRKEYLEAYENYVISSYVPLFREYKGQSIEVLGATPMKREGDFMVATKVTSKDAAPIALSFRVRVDGKCFKVYDMVAEGVSIVNTQRQDFTSIISRKGFDELLVLLKSKKVEAKKDAEKPAA